MDKSRHPTRDVRVSRSAHYEPGFRAAEHNRAFRSALPNRAQLLPARRAATPNSGWLHFERDLAPPAQRPRPRRVRTGFARSESCRHRELPGPAKRADSGLANELYADASPNELTL